MQHFDIAIVGAGPIGASLALAFEHLPLRIALIEAKEFAFATNTPDRPLSLSYSSVEILKTLGIWSSLKETAFPIREIHVSEKNHFGHTHLRADESKVEAFGQVVGFGQFAYTLQQAAKKLANLTWICPAKVVGLTAQTHHGQLKQILQLEDGTALSADLIVAADGANSIIKSLLRIESDTRDYETAAIATQVQVQHFSGIAYERFLKEGVVAFLPVSEKKYGVVWAGKTQTMNDLMAASEESFLEQLQTAFGYRLGQLTDLEARQTHPLKRVLAKEMIRPGVVLVGNAAQTLHPIAAQGFNLGLRSTAFLAEVLAEAYQSRAFLGSLAVLETYLDRSTTTREQTHHFTNGLHTLFHEQFFPLVPLRRTAMTVMPFVPPIKRFLAKVGMGATGPLPQLAQGIPLVKKSV